MRLISDFTDYYDHNFDGGGAELHRISTRGLAKPDQFRLLSRAGYVVPPHGLVKDVGGSWNELEKRYVRALVVYDDLFAHRGEGKRLIQEMHYRFDGNVSRLPQLYELGEKFCSAFIGWPLRGYCESIRHLLVGHHHFVIQYRSDDRWRSNCGNVTCQTLSWEPDWDRPAALDPYPLCAIDFVTGKDGLLWAVDFNNAPGVRHSGVERFLKPAEFVAALSEYCEGVSKDA
jgi:hypothetical protein